MRGCKILDGGAATLEGGLCRWLSGEHRSSSIGCPLGYVDGEGCNNGWSCRSYYNQWPLNPDPDLEVQVRRGGSPLGVIECLCDESLPILLELVISWIRQLLDKLLVVGESSAVFPLLQGQLLEKGPFSSQL